MRIITRKRLEEFGSRFADARGPLEDWAQKVESARWQGLHDTRKVFSSADEVRTGSNRTATVFNIKGNRYRLIAAIHYDRQRVFVMRFLTHAEYSRDHWKDTI